MANSKSASKNARKGTSRMLHNRQAKSRLKTLEHQFQACLEGNDEAASRKVAAEFSSALDRAAKSSIIHRNKAARKKSACAKRLAGAPVPSQETVEAPQEEPIAEDEGNS